ncbi:unnamed protein product [Adineta steineri]|uniref:Inosine/uridine-preferring nucleoside hydrolase domain-containing protein n=1 Tax=Adineta steineri TaxID=433720 RepID=A0A815LJX5_9BILA|nr:unnamed protein product [Adineta steineri]
MEVRKMLGLNKDASLKMKTTSTMMLRALIKCVYPNPEPGLILTNPDESVVKTIITNNCRVYSRALTYAEQQIQLCINQDGTRQPLIIDTDSDVDDLWAIHYVLNVPTIDVLAITTVGDGYTKPLYSGSNVLTFLDLIGCSNGVGVGFGATLPLISAGFQISPALLDALDTYITSPTCLNQSVNIFLQPSPFSAIELIKLTLKYSKVPVDILVLGTMTNLATAISEDRSIVSKIGTLYFSGGQFKPLSNYSSLMPNLTIFNYLYDTETLPASPNAYLDIFAMQRVATSGIKKIVAIPGSTQRTLPVNLTQLFETLKRMNITLKPFVLNFISSLAKCQNATESDMKWWDNSAAQFMVQIQTNNSQGFCRQTKNVQSLYIMSADAHQFYGQGVIDTDMLLPNASGLVNYTICTQADSSIFLAEFLTKINSEKLYSCQHQYSQRFDIRLQQSVGGTVWQKTLNILLDMGDTCDWRRRALDTTPEILLEVLRAQKKIIDEVKETWIFQYIEIEMHDNGTIKRIKRGLDWKGILSFGVVIMVCGIAIYVIGPTKIVNAVKELMKGFGVSSITTTATASS